MANSADFLLSYYGSKPNERSKIDIFAVFHALEDIRQTLDVMATAGHNVTMFQMALPRWGTAVASNLGTDMRWIEGQGWNTPHEGDIGLLEALSDRMMAVSNAADSKTRRHVQTFVDKATQALVDDNSLPEEFRWHLAKVLLHVKNCLIEYDVRGDVELADAVERLIGAIRLAEEKSTDASKWSKVWDDYGKPIVVGLFVELTAGAVGFGGILAIAAGAGG